jgi:hypothetical protein
MDHRKRNVIILFIVAIVAGFLIEVFSPELQKAGLSERLVDALAAGITGGGLIYLAINVPKMKNTD